jgi:pre-mRNA-splicing factor RBM22/SLT11
MLDLSFGLPIVVRDAALKMITPGPNSEINREYYAQNHEKEIEEGKGATEAYEKTDEKARDLLRRLAQSEPHYKRQRRLEEEEASSGQRRLGGPGTGSGPSSEGARPGPIRTKDSRPAGYGPPSRPVKGASRARPFPNTAALPPQPQDILPPADKHVMSLFVTGVEDDLPEHEVRTYFSQFGALRSLVCSHRSHCAFVNYMSRETAEAAAAACQGRAVVKGVPLRVQWGKPKTLDNMDREARMANARAGRETVAAVKAASSTKPAITAGPSSTASGPSHDSDNYGPVAPPPGSEDVQYASLAGE